MADEPAPTGDLTRLLARIGAGDPAALDQAFPLVYDELRRLARARVGRSDGTPTLSATALVHEAYLKLSRGAPIRPESRAHFFAIAARAMRQVLTDRARQRAAAKRGGGQTPITLSDGLDGVEVDPLGMLALSEALDTLSPRQQRIVEARFFAGMEEEEIAEALGISDRTVRREWVKARAWLFLALGPERLRTAGDRPDAAAPLPDPE